MNLEPTKDTVEFGQVVKALVEKTNVTDQDLSLAFDISLVAARRWRAGQCSAHPSLRQHILDYFESRVST